MEELNIINYINDIVNDKGHFLTQDELRLKYKVKLNFLNIYSLQKAIPEYWKQILQNENQKPFKENLMSNVWLNLNECVTDLISISTKEIYWFCRTVAYQGIFIDASRL